MVSWTFEIAPDGAEVGDPCKNPEARVPAVKALEQLYMVNIYQLWS